MISSDDLTIFYSAKTLLMAWIEGSTFLRGEIIFIEVFIPLSGLSFVLLTTKIFKTVHVDIDFVFLDCMNSFWLSCLCGRLLSECF